MAIYQEVCKKCGYVGGLVNVEKYGTCPICGFPIDHQIVHETAEEQASRAEAHKQSLLGFFWMGVFLLGYTFIFFPGAMITMLLNNWIDFEPGWGQWFCGVGMSLLMFLFCGFNWKKYLVLDIILVSICSIIGWLSSFSPWAFAAKTLMPMWFD